MDNICYFEGCNKKIKIYDLPCKCKKIFCKIHKYPENHNCEYDYKESFKKQKLIDDMKCVSNKLEKINN